MKRNEILSEIQVIFRDIFDDNNLIIKEETCSDDIEEWDSIENINIILSIEKKFDVEFDIDEVGEVKNVSDIITLVLRKKDNYNV